LEGVPQPDELEGRQADLSPADGSAAKVTSVGDLNDRRSSERETEINIQMRRLKWENERLEKEAVSVRRLSQEAVETARQSQAQTLEECATMKMRLQALTGEVDELRAFVEMSSRTKEQNEKKRQGRRKWIVLTAAVGLAFGAYSLRDQATMLMPWVGDLMQSVGARVKVGVEYFNVSNMEAERMGDTVRVKVNVTNNYPLPAEAPAIRFMVKDSGGVLLAEREVKMGLASLNPRMPATVATQIVLPSHLEPSVLTDVVALPVEAPTAKL
jgi:hypothetical protein